MNYVYELKVENYPGSFFIPPQALTMHVPLRIIIVSYNKSGDIYNACLILLDGKLRKAILITVLTRKAHNNK
jgi:hypothetical protein